MKINIAAPAVVSGKMKHNFDSIHRRARDTRLAQIRFHKSDVSTIQMLLDVAEPAAREIVHHTHLRAAFDKRVHQVRPDEGSPSRDQNLLTIPDDGLPFFPVRLLQ